MKLRFAALAALLIAGGVPQSSLYAQAPPGQPYLQVPIPDLLCKINCHSYLVEHDRVGQFESLLQDKQLGVGAVDVQAPNIETGALIAERIRAYSWLAPDQTIITSTCGFNHLPRHIALGKMRAMAEAKAILGGGSASS
jgi:methionine synthase II (cobalamin-independent)